MISITAYVALGFLALRTLVIVVNYIYSRIAFRDPESTEADVSILIPCRNEEKNIGRLLSLLMALEDEPLEIIVCDDQSTDRTFDIAARFSSRHSKIRCFHGAPLPVGYTGKNWACEQLAEQAEGSFMLFIDADITLEGNIVGLLISHMEKKKLDLLSVFPKQEMLTLGERSTVPVMNWILISLLPLPLIRLSRLRSFSAANGQFMLYRALAYRNLEPHRQLRSNPAEDIASMKLFKKYGLRCATFTGDDRIRCRMYRGRKEALTGFSKNVLHYFSGNFIWLMFYVIFTTFGLLFIALWSVSWFLVSLVAAVMGRILLSLASHQNPANNLLLSPIQHFNFLCMLFLAWKQKIRGTITWKDRQINIP